MVYQYTTLSATKIRLLTLLPGRFGSPLQGEVGEADFSPDPDVTPPYEALSYTWGDEKRLQPLSVLNPDGGPSGTIGLRPNLYSALQHLRLEDQARVIWCDLISINQGDEKEKGQEIARMSSIYSRAQRVVIWLGLEAEDSALAVKAIQFTGLQVEIRPEQRTWCRKENADPRFCRESQQVPHSPTELEAIQKLFARSWFKRLWVRQEVTLAKSAIVLVGHDQMSWMSLLSTAAFLDTFIRLRRTSGSDFGRDLLNLVQFASIAVYKDIMQIFHACRACKCQLDHDRVYAILGLLSSERALCIQPDYSKGAKRVYQDVVMQYYQHYRRLDTLTLCELAERPSWVPDLEKLSFNTGVNTRVSPYCWASGQAAALLVVLDNNTMETYGVRCGTLGKTVASSMSKDSEPRVLKTAIVEILMKHLGRDVARWDANRLEILTKGLLGCIWYERTGRKNHSSLPYAVSELRNWASEDPERFTDDSLSHESIVLMNHIIRVLFHGDSCRWTHDKHVGLGYSGCREGDVLYAILGCRRLIACRREPARGIYRIVGLFDHPAYNDGEAFLGKLAPGWQVSYRHQLLASNRPKFVYQDGPEPSEHWEDPRLQHVALPDGWHEDKDQNGYPYWFKAGLIDERGDSDPRLTLDELKKRGIKMEKLIIV